MPKIDGLIESYTLIARPSKKGETPKHLVPYHEGFKQAARDAAQATKHLRGERRVVAMNDYLKRKLQKLG